MLSLSGPFHLPEGDLLRTAELLGPALKELDGAKLFLTGTTGFVGKWLLGFFFFLSSEMGLRTDITVLTRRPRELLKSYPGLESIQGISFLEGDVRSFKRPGSKRNNYDFVIHGATDVVSQGVPWQDLDVAFTGTKNLLSQVAANTNTRLLVLSSGAVYPRSASLAETLNEGLFDPAGAVGPWSIYTAAKQLLEISVASLSHVYDFDWSIARIFALAGPHLPLDKHYALGNFLLSAMTSREIYVNGDGTPVRSYLYASDLTAWLIKILLCGESGESYNVGSDEQTSINDLAELVAKLLGATVNPSRGQTSEHGGHNPIYIPDISKTDTLLGLKPTVPLAESILATAEWVTEMISEHGYPNNNQKRTI